MERGKREWSGENGEGRGEKKMGEREKEDRDRGDERGEKGESMVEMRLEKEERKGKREGGQTLFSSLSVSTRWCRRSVFVHSLQNCVLML